MSVCWNGSSMEDVYRRWLIGCVFFRGKSTLWCARQIDADPEDIRRDFEQIVTEPIEFAA